MSNKEDMQQLKLHRNRLEREIWRLWRAQRHNGVRNPIMVRKQAELKQINNQIRELEDKYGL